MSVYLGIEAARHVAETLANSHNRIFLDSNSLLMNMLTDFVNDESVKAAQ